MVKMYSWPLVLVAVAVEKSEPHILKLHWSSKEV